MAPAGATTSLPPSVDIEELAGEHVSEVENIGKLRLSVPGAPRLPLGALHRAHIAIYGEPKVGKTTFAASAPGTWFVATEQGQDWVTCREPTLIHDWEQWLDFCIWFEEQKPTYFGDGTPIQTLAIDRLEGLFKMCEEYVKKQLTVESLDELEHGKGWNRLTTEWDRVMSRVRRWPYGLITISHVKQKQLRGKHTKVDKLEPDIGAAGVRWLAGSADLILYAHTQQEPKLDAKGEPTGDVIERRVIRCHPSSMCMAGGRMAHLLPSIMPLDYKRLRERIDTARAKESAR